MSSLLHPGVYVREMPSGVRAVEGVPTSTTIFVGETERGPLTPTRVKGIADYERQFGGYLRSDGTTAGTARVTMRYSIGGFFANGGTSAYVVRAMPSSGAVAASRTLGATTARFVAANPGVWANGHLSVVLAPSSSGSANEARVLVFYRDLRKPSDRRVLVEDFDRLDVSSAAATAENDVAQVLERSSFIRWDPGASPPANLGGPLRDTTATRPTDVTNTVIDGAALAGGVLGATAAVSTDMPGILARLDGVDDAALLVFAPETWAQAQGADSTTFAALHDEVLGYVQNRPKLDLFYVADLLAQHDQATPTLATSDTRTLAQAATTSNFMGWYWPHLVVGDPVGQGLNPTRRIPPAGFVAGLCARTDRLRGVWKAPAGVEATVTSIVGVQHELLDTHQDDLNPIGVNVIRRIPGAGVVVWGSRTTQPASEWRYVPVRRTAMFLRKSIYNGIQWAVFEPNNQDLWRALRVTIGAFMETQYRNGAFAGATSKEAYFVKCDAETTPESAQLAGIVNIIVGFAPLRPAEFVVVNLTQMTKLAS